MVKNKEHQALQLKYARAVSALRNFIDEFCPSIDSETSLAAEREKRLEAESKVRRLREAASRVSYGLTLPVNDVERAIRKVLDAALWETDTLDEDRGVRLVGRKQTAPDDPKGADHD